MKHTKFTLASIMLSALFVILSLSGQTSTGTTVARPPSTANSSNRLALNWTSYVDSASFQWERVDFIDAASSGDVSYTLSGLGGSGQLKMGLRNKTERSWIVSIEVGTEFEPGDTSVQRMVATRKIEVHLHPHEQTTLELEVNCLDISKPPPSQSNTSWTSRRSSRLAQFLRCANEGIDQAKRGTREAQLLEDARPLLIQFSLWSARGATRGEWIDFWVHYQHMPRQQAVELVNAFAPALEEITRSCQSLTSL